MSLSVQTNLSMQNQMAFKGKALNKAGNLLKGVNERIMPAVELETKSNMLVEFIKKCSPNNIKKAIDY